MMAERSAALIFAPGQTRAARRISRIITGGMCTGGCRICTDEKRFESQLKRLPRLRPITVLLANRPEVLDQVLSLSGWFEDTPLVIMVPDSHHDTIAKAHRLRPRYLMPPEFDYRELQAVVHRILGRRKTAGPAGPLAKTRILAGRKNQPAAFLRNRRKRRRFRPSVRATQPFRGVVPQEVDAATTDKMQDTVRRR